MLNDFFFYVISLETQGLNLYFWIQSLFRHNINVSKAEESKVIWMTTK